MGWCCSNLYNRWFLVKN